MILDLNACFPEGKDGSRKPLPKQKEVINQVLRTGSSKYVAYVGGIGSGKSLIGCVVMLMLAVLYPGDYLICRQFLPELKITTYKQFIDICPPELIAEHRMADMMIKIKAAGGKTSNVYFRQLKSLTSSDL
jgi:phage terminase large subunit